LPPPYAKRSYRIWSQAQSQLAALSSDSVHGVDTSAEHLIPTEDLGAVITAVKQVIRAARNHGRLPRCRTVFRGISGIRCV
jgi:hypothetical protein